MGRKTVETTASGLNQFIGKQGLSPLDTEEVTELGQYFPSSGGDSGFEPTEAQLEAMNSGITAAKVAAYDTLPDEDDVKDIISDHFVAGTNVTITDNVDGTQTISSTASGGFTPTTDQLAAMNSGITAAKVAAYDAIQGVPSQTASDLGRVLTAVGGDTYGWAELPSVNEVPAVGPDDDGKVLTATYSGSTGTYAWTASSAPTPPTAYTVPTAGTGVTYVAGGYVVSNNICTINLYYVHSSNPTQGQVLFSGLPVPALKVGGADNYISTVLTLGSATPTNTLGATGGHAYLNQGGSIVSSNESYSSLGGGGKMITGSYLIDTST